jgi:hypothetical protein
MVIKRFIIRFSSNVGQSWTSIDSSHFFPSSFCDFVSLLVRRKLDLVEIEIDG